MEQDECMGMKEEEYGWYHCKNLNQRRHDYNFGETVASFITHEQSTKLWPLEIKAGKHGAVVRKEEHWMELRGKGWWMGKLFWPYTGKENQNGGSITDLEGQQWTKQTSCCRWYSGKHFMKYDQLSALEDELSVHSRQTWPLYVVEGILVLLGG